MKRRKVDSESRNRQEDQLSDFERLDKLPAWSSFLEQLPKSTVVLNHQLACITEPDGVNLLTLKGGVVQLAVTIKDTFAVQAKSYQTTVPIRDLLGFQWRIERWLQLDAIVVRTKNTPPCLKEEVREISDHLERMKELATESFDDTRLTFMSEQLRLFGVPPTSRRYSPAALMNALSIFLINRHSYQHLRQFLFLPHPDTLKGFMAPLAQVGSASEMDTLVASHFNSLERHQRFCLIIFDEMYVKPSLRFRGCHIIGNAVDDETKAARTILALMVKPLFGASSFIVRLIPLFKLSLSILKNELEKVAQCVEAHEGHLVGIVGDNHFVNRQLFAELREPNTEFLGRFPSIPHQFVLLYDPVHGMKSVRNNWITEGREELKFVPPGDAGNNPVIGKWRDICAIHSDEMANTVRTTSLKYQSCYPTPIERQKVSLLNDVFNDKTVAALKCKGKIETAIFLEHFVRVWKIFNVKTPDAHRRYSICFIENHDFNE